MRSFGVFLVLLFSTWCAATGQPVVTAPAERTQFRQPTSYDTLCGFLRTIDGTHTRVMPIAETIENRVLNAVFCSASDQFGADTAKLRVLLFAQQHGDEPSGKEALTLLLARIASGGLKSLLAKADLIIVPLMNPDGAELGRRRNASGADLNRTHVLLSSPETKGLHDLFFRWMPHVTLDLHEYGSNSKAWSDSGFIKRGDVMLGMLTNRNTPAAVYALQHERIFPFIAERMRDRGFSFQEYIVGTPQDRIRHSTTEINDGRQSFGILGTMSFIQEGRNWGGPADHLERRALAQLTSLEALLEFCADNAAQIRTIVREERMRLSSGAVRTVAIRMDHKPGTRTLTIPVTTVPGGIDTVWRVRPYHSEVVLQKTADLPKQYLVPAGEADVLALLLRHHCTVDTVKRGMELQAVSYRIDRIDTVELEEDPMPFVYTTKQRETITAKPGDVLVPCAQLHAVFLGIVLEPESYWGLLKYSQFAGLLKIGEYPIKRIE